MGYVAAYLPGGKEYAAGKWEYESKREIPTGRGVFGKNPGRPFPFWGNWYIMKL